MLARIAPGFILRRGGGLASSSVSTRVPPGGRSSIPRRAAFATRASGGDEKAKGKDKAKKKETLKAAPPQPKASQNWSFGGAAGVPPAPPALKMADFRVK